MEKFKKTSKLLKPVLCLMLAIAIILGHFAFPVALRAKAEDSEDDYTGVYQTSPVTIANGQFDSSTGLFPKSPSSWTGSVFETGSADIVSGVIDLSGDSYTSNSTKYELSRYDEYKDGAIPQTPFGKPYKPNGSFPYYENTTTNVLMLNTKGNTTTYKYTSSSIALEANSFYVISAWAKTGDFKGFQDSGAAIKLTGIEDEDIGFKNINTTKDNPSLSLENLYGWQEYSIYVATDYKSRSVSLSLQIGDYGDGYYHPTNGYVFFANVTAYQIAPETFEKETATNSSRIKVANLNKSDYITKNDENGIAVSDGTVEIGSFTNVGSKNLPEGWNRISEDGVGGALISAYNPKEFNASNIYNLENNPSAPLGIERSGGNNILVISSYSGSYYKEVAAGVRSSKILIERNRYYRLAAWVKSQDTTSIGATIAIKGQKTEYDTELSIVSSGLVGNDQNLDRYGWEQHAFYIKGSIIMDRLIEVELWLGQPDQLSRGIAMFDDITIESLTEREYNDNVAGGTDVQFDGDLSGNTGVPNGLFYMSGPFEDEYPLPPSQWTMFDASNVETVGFSTQAVNTDSIKSGIIPVDKDHFDANRYNYFGAANPLPNQTLPRNVLFMGSEIETAFCYRSSDITISTSVNALYVNIMTDRIIGYGANLVLKNGNKILSTIEKINTNGKFETYTFYVEGNQENISNVTIEIWLGLGDKNLNRSKLSSGIIFVEEVGLKGVSSEEESFDTVIERYGDLKNTNVATLNNDYFNNFNRYDESFVKESYNWNIDTSLNEYASPSKTTYGIFDYTTLKSSNQSNVPLDFKSDESGNTKILFMQNGSPNAATLIYDTNYTLTESMFYKISVSMKVDIPKAYLEENPKAVGAGIALRGTDYKFEDIKDSREYATVYNPSTNTESQKLVDNEFKTYTFFVQVDSTTPSTVSFEISLGGYENVNEFCLGRVYVANFTIEEIDKDIYKENVEDLEDDDRYIINADLTLTSDEETGEETGEEKEKTNWWQHNWYVLPSAIFGITLVLALAFVFGRKFMEARPKRAKKAKRSDYDRKNIGKDETVVEEIKETTYEEFDDDRVSAPSQDKVEANKKVLESNDETAIVEDTKDELKADSAESKDEAVSNDSANDLSEFDE